MKKLSFEAINGWRTAYRPTAALDRPSGQWRDWPRPGRRPQLPLGFWPYSGGSAPDSRFDRFGTGARIRLAEKLPFEAIGG